MTYIRKKQQEQSRSINLQITTNGTLMTPEILLAGTFGFTPFTDYARGGDGEFFAETYALYLTDSNRLSAMNRSSDRIASLRARRHADACYLCDN